jgi:hypothetical protein
MSDETQYTLCIDTEQYAGNFEREMTAWVCGLANCEGRVDVLRVAKLAREEIPESVQDWFEEHTRAGGEYNDCCGIVPTPGWFNDGSGHHFKEGQNTKCWRKHKWPAYQSVGIYLDAKPPEEVLAVVRERAASYNEACPHSMSHEHITITGFRLVTEKTTTITTEEPL